jgi:RimJ/RimL family protein N-acetyltransferase
VKLQLLAATEKEISIIQSLATAIWNQHYPAIIGQQQVDYMLKKMYAADAMMKQMQTGQQFYLLHRDELAIGFLSVEHQGEGDYFLNKCYIRTDEQRSGAGTCALKSVLALYPKWQNLRLQVNRQNHKAINFYFKFGFTIEKVADFDIGDGYSMNDFVMLLKR